MNLDQHRQLLDDVLLDEELIDFKGKVLNQCLGELRRRQVRRYCLYAVTSVAAILLSALILRFDAQTSPIGPADRRDTSTYIVRTTGLPEQQIVRTVMSCEAVRTQNNHLVVCNTASVSDLIVRKQHKVAWLDDSEMLRLFEGVACGIIRPQGGQSRLVFFDPKDTQRFLGTP